MKIIQSNITKTVVHLDQADLERIVDFYIQNNNETFKFRKMPQLDLVYEWGDTDDGNKVYLDYIYQFIGGRK